LGMGRVVGVVATELDGGPCLDGCAHGGGEFKADKVHG
jgi:hypothetical protein